MISKIGEDRRIGGVLWAPTTVIMNYIYINRSTYRAERTTGALPLVPVCDPPPLGAAEAVVADGGDEDPSRPSSSTSER
jgi:hypothetical protein